MTSMNTKFSILARSWKFKKTRDNSFLQTPSQSLTGKQKNPSLRTSRHINNITAYMCTFSSILNCSYANQKYSIISGWKYRSKGLLKAFFHQKSNRKTDKLCMKFSSTSSKVIQYRYDTFQYVDLILYPVICSRKILLQLQTKGWCKKEKGSYKFMFSLKTVAFYCKKILQLTI